MGGLMKKVQIGINDKNIKYDFRETCFGIYVKDKKIYLTKKNGEVSLIGGGKETGETFQECLYREFLEESGCKVKTIKDFCSIDCFWFTRNKKHMESLAHIFLVDIEEDIDEPLEKGSELVLIDINSALDYLKLPYQRKALELYLTEYGDLL